ncbi:MAG: helix-hairpin-helix domain-containing protein [Cytophagales bacterium]|nr:helix-hairpin-helix domain-containing protein [Cytophagales bacterium]MDW8384154.1 helix-hairpin-helix domain-containing protein [Flammeovirgaceae bacterium]
MRRLVCLLVFWGTIVIAQTPKRPEIDVDDFIQNLFNLQDEEADYESFYEAMLQMYTDPLDLNRATREDLQNLFILTEYQINSFLKYRAKNGKLLTIYELQAIEGFDRATFQKLLPFVEVRDAGMAADASSIFRRMLQNDNNRFLMLRYARTLQTKRGYRPEIKNGYLGDPDQLYARFLSRNTQDFSYGFTLEKDAGERFFWSPPRRYMGIDFFSYHLTLYNRGRWKTISLGDYQLQIGQGLLLTGGFQVGKGAEPTATLRRNTLGILPYTSLLETRFFRGAAATYELSSNVEVTSFYSDKYIDAGIRENRTTFSAAEELDSLAILTEEGIQNIDEVSEFSATLRQFGMHRTASELAAYKTLREQVVGTNIHYKSPNKRFMAGLTALNTLFSIPIQREPTDYNQFEFQGKNNFVIGADYAWSIQNTSFFGEIGRSQSGGIGIIQGLASSLAKTVEFAAFYRNYQKNFHTLYGRAIGENSRNINEEGFYMGLKYSPSRQWQFALYYDQFRFPWLKFRVDAPTAGDEWLFRATYRPSRTITLYFQARQEDKPRNLADNITRIDYPTPTTRRNYMVNADYRASEKIHLRSRVQWSDFSQIDLDTRRTKTTYGYAIMQDITWDITSNFELAARFANFDTDDFDNRQFAYEKDVLYAFAIPAYYGRGWRNYYVIRWKITRKIDFWCKYAYFLYQRTPNDNNTIGSGLEQINGNQKTDIRAQLRFKF